MIISMKLHATRQEIDEVRNQVAHFGYKVHSIEGEERVVIGVVGVGDVTACMESVESMPQVEKVVRISAPYKFVSKQFRAGKTTRARERHGSWRRRICGDGGAVLGGIGSADHARGGGSGRGGRENPARRRVQAADFAVRFSGHGRGRAEIIAEGKEGHGPGDYHGSDERPRRRFDRAVRGHHASGRAQHAEFRAAESAGKMRATGAA